MADIDECPDVELCDGSGPRNGDSGAFAIGLCFVLAGEMHTPNYNSISIIGHPSPFLRA